MPVDEIKVHLQNVKKYIAKKIADLNKGRRTGDQTEHETAWNGIKKINRVSVGITVDAPVTANWNKTNDIQYFKDI